MLPQTCDADAGSGAAGPRQGERGQAGAACCGTREFGCLMSLLRLMVCLQVAIKFLERGDRINERYVGEPAECSAPASMPSAAAHSLGSPPCPLAGREIYNHSQLLHPHIVQFKEVFLTPHYLGICMEFAEVRRPPRLLPTL